MQPAQTASHFVQLVPPDGFDLLDDVLPIYVAENFPTRDPPQQLGLLFGPEEDIAMVEIVGHGSHTSRTAGAVPQRLPAPPTLV